MDFPQIVFDFLEKYFVEPINQYQGYNPVNTLVYAAILFAMAFFVIFPVLDRKKIKFNLRFMLSLFPYIFFAISMRVLEDVQLIARAAYPWQLGYYFISPGIWIATAAIVISAILISRTISRKLNKDENLVFGSIGIVLWIPVFAFDLLMMKRPVAFFEVLALAAMVTAIAYYAMKFLKKDLLKDKMNLLAVASQSLDGTATFIATSFYGYGEQHFVSNFILGINPLLFVIVKVILVLVILHYLEKEIKNENLRGFLKVVLIILGTATGSRDLLTLAVGSNI